MVTKLDERRLRDGARALALPDDDLSSLSDEALRVRIRELDDGAGAMQSLDDLGSREKNEQAWRDFEAIMAKLEEARREQKRRRERAGPP